MHKPTIETGFDIKRFTPERAIKTAYQMWLADNRKTGSVAQQAAQLVICKILEEISAFKGDALANQYLTDWLAEVNNCSGTITSRKIRRDDELRATRNAHDDNVGMMGKNLIVAGFTSSAWKILLIAVSVYAVLVQFLTSIHVIHVTHIGHGGGAHPLDPRITAGAIAAGTALLLSAWRAWSLPRKVRKLAKRLLDDIEKAHASYRQDARKEYERCGHRIAALWQELHGCQAPPTEGIEYMIDVSGEGNSEDLAGEDVALRKPFWRRLLGRTH
jgi:hypothetical protein